MPRLTHEQMTAVEHGEVVPIESNIDSYNSAGQSSGKLTVNFSPSLAQLCQLKNGQSVLYEADAVNYGPHGGTPSTPAVRIYPPHGY